MNAERIRSVAFADESVREAFLELGKGRFEEKQLSKWIQGAISDLKENPFAGIATLRGNAIEIISVILEWLSHKDYEKRFGYKAR